MKMKNLDVCRNCKHGFMKHGFKADPVNESKFLRPCESKNCSCVQFARRPRKLKK